VATFISGKTGKILGQNYYETEEKYFIFYPEDTTTINIYSTNSKALK
jgi:hypothetical protein